MKQYSDGILKLIERCGDEWTYYFTGRQLNNPTEVNAIFLEHARTRALALLEALETVTGASWYYNSTHGEMRVCEEDEQ